MLKYSIPKYADEKNGRSDSWVWTVKIEGREL